MASENDHIHPKVRQAMEAIHHPQVQEMMQRLSSFGLAIAVPHMHGNEGQFVPLPSDMVALESGLVVSFRPADELVSQPHIPVMWRWDEGAQVAAGCFYCTSDDRSCCKTSRPSTEVETSPA